MVKNLGVFFILIFLVSILIGCDQLIPTTTTTTTTVAPTTTSSSTTTSTTTPTTTTSSSTSTSLSSTTSTIGTTTSSFEGTTTSSTSTSTTTTTTVLTIDYKITYNKAILYTNSIGTVWMQGIVEVTNTGNTNLYLSSGKFDIEDESGNLLASKSLISVYPQIIAPNEKAYYYKETTLDNVTSDTKIIIKPQVDILKAKVNLIKFPVSDISMTDKTYGGIKVIGRVENNTKEEQSYVYLCFILFDSSDNPIGLISKILTDTIGVGLKTGFETSSFAFPESINLSSISRYEFVSYPRQFQF